jgi:hypothetical protein
VPDDVSRFAVCDAECVRLHHAAYWASLADRPPVPDEPGAVVTVTIRVSKENLLTPTSLISLIAGGHGQGEQP